MVLFGSFPFPCFPFVYPLSFLLCVPWCHRTLVASCCFYIIHISHVTVAFFFSTFFCYWFSSFIKFIVLRSPSFLFFFRLLSNFIRTVVFYHSHTAMVYFLPRSVTPQPFPPSPLLSSSYLLPFLSWHSEWRKSTLHGTSNLYFTQLWILSSPPVPSSEQARFPLGLPSLPSLPALSRYSG